MATVRSALFVVLAASVGCGGPRPEFPESSVCGSSFEAPAALEAVSLAIVPPGPISGPCGVEGGVAVCNGGRAPEVANAVQAVAAGRGACTLDADGKASCWFTDAWAAVKPEGSFVKLAMGQGASVCGIRSDGSISCFGKALGGEIPDGPYVDVTVGVDHACALKADGAAVCWPAGPGKYCQGDPAPGPFVRLATPVDGYTTCGVRSDGSAACWGRDVGAIPGAPPYLDVVAVDAAKPGICALSVDGTVACDVEGLPEPPAGPFTALSSMDGGVCALGAGRPVCWGWGLYTRTAAPPTAVAIVTSTAVDKAGWSEVQTDGAAVSFPSASVEEEHVLAGDVPVHRWSWTTTSPGPQLLALEIVEVPADIVAAGPEAILEFAVLSKVQAFGGGEAKRLNHRRLQGRDGASFYVEYPDGRAVRSDAYVDGGRLFVASGMSMRDDGDAWGRAHTMQHSLRFVD